MHPRRRSELRSTTNLILPIFALTVALAACEEVTLEFIADRSSQYPIELHASDDPQGVTIGIFTVHER